jgi:hypothetical protein
MSISVKMELNKGFSYMLRFLAGLFDAEGCVTLSPGGYPRITLSMCCEISANLFKDYFKGSVKKRQRKHKKDIYTWDSLIENQKRFITEIEIYSLIKRPQLLLLREYLHLRRTERKSRRKEFVSAIAACKRPRISSKEELDIPTTIIPKDEFYQWFAGFMEGDGSFNCWESKTLSHKKPSFSTSVEAMNCQPDVIKYIKERLEGSIGVNKQNINPVWKWLSSPQNTLSVLARLYPHLISKQEQCKLLMEFRTIIASRKRKPVGRKSGKCKIGGWHNPDFLFTKEEVTRLREIICRMKFLHN